MCTNQIQFTKPRPMLVGNKSNEDSRINFSILNNSGNIILQYRCYVNTEIIYKTFTF